MVGAAEDLNECLIAEAAAARAYWDAWRPLLVRFPCRDDDRVPGHWRTFGTRTSPLTGSPRLAANPANAILNYLYALVEAETRIALLTVGLDPALGVHRGEVVLEDAGWGCPAECSVGSVVIVEMHEPGVGAGPLGF